MTRRHAPAMCEAYGRGPAECGSPAVTVRPGVDGRPVPSCGAHPAPFGVWPCTCGHPAAIHGPGGCGYAVTVRGPAMSGTRDACACSGGIARMDPRPSAYVRRVPWYAPR